MSDTGKIIALAKAVGARPDPEDVKQNVEDWLDDHPEATTTVEDGSITRAKLASGLEGDLAAVEGGVTELLTIIDNVAKIEIIHSSEKVGCYASFSGGKANVYTGYPGCTTRIYDVSGLRGDKLTLNVTRKSGATNMFYVAADESGSVLDYYNASNVTVLTDREVTIPQTAALLYVNYDTETANISVTGYKKITDVENELAEVKDKLYYVKDKEGVLYVSYNNTYAYVSGANKALTSTVSGCKVYMYDLSGFKGKLAKVTTTASDAEHLKTAIIAKTGGIVAEWLSGDLTNAIMNIPNDATYLYVNCKDTETPEVMMRELLTLTDAFGEIALTGADHRISGKKCVCFGDSITWYDGHEYNWGKEQGVTAKGYETYLRDAGMDVNNQGYSGATIRNIVNEKILDFDFTGYDYVTITSGANDSRYDIPVGEIAEVGSTFDTTFIGRLQAGIEYILESNPEIKILLMTPIRGWIYAPDGYAITPPPEDDGNVDEKYAEAIKAVADFYGLPVCDWYENCGLSLLTRSWYINDPEPDKTAEVNPNILYSLHPSTKGYARMAELLLPIVRSI